MCISRVHGDAREKFVFFSPFALPRVAANTDAQVNGGEPARVVGVRLD